jgi:porin
MAFISLGDRQLSQVAPSSPNTAYRGLYAGFSAMYAPPETVIFSQSYEARLYTIGLFESRPTDMISLIYNRNEFSHYFANAMNASTSSAAVLGFAVPMAHRNSNTIGLGYLAHLMPGIYWNIGVSYTDHPSVTYFNGEGSSLIFNTGTTFFFLTLTGAPRRRCLIEALLYRLGRLVGGPKILWHPS